MSIGPFNFRDASRRKGMDVDDLQRDIALPAAPEGEEPEGIEVGSIWYNSTTDSVRLRTPAGDADIGGASSGDIDGVTAGTGLSGGGTVGTVSLAVVYGSTAGTSAQGNDSRLSDARTPTAHATSHRHGGSDEVATAVAAANAIPKAGAGGTLAIGWIPTGSTGSTVALGNDSRLSDARTPTSHATSHQDGGSDEISLTGLSGLAADAQLTAVRKAGTLVGTRPTINFIDGSNATVTVADDAGNNRVNVTVAASGGGGGDIDEIVTNAADGLAGGTTSGTATLSIIRGTSANQTRHGNDAAYTNARTPTSHATSHQNGGSDEIATATAGANAIPKAGAGGTLAIGWIPTGSTGSTVAIGNDARLSDSRAPNGAAGGQLGGTYPNPDVRGLRETSGPTNLTIGAVADGEFLKRVGSTVVGASAGGGSALVVWSGYTGTAPITTEPAGIGTQTPTFSNITIATAGRYLFEFGGEGSIDGSASSGDTWSPLLLATGTQTSPPANVSAFLGGNVFTFNSFFRWNNAPVTPQFPGILGNSGLLFPTYFPVHGEIMFTATGAGNVDMSFPQDGSALVNKLNYTRKMWGKLTFLGA